MSQVNNTSEQLPRYRIRCEYLLAALPEFKYKNKLVHGLGVDVCFRVMKNYEEVLLEYTENPEEKLRTLLCDKTFTVKDFWSCKLDKKQYSIQFVRNNCSSSSGADVKVVYFDYYLVTHNEDNVLERTKISSTNFKSILKNHFIHFNNEHNADVQECVYNLKPIIYDEGEMQL